MLRTLVPLGLVVAALGSSHAADGEAPVRPREPLESSVTVERRIFAVRSDPRVLSRPTECDRLRASDLDVRIDGRRARITSVERMPTPSVFWLLLDTSASVDDVHEAVKRDALRTLREVVESEEAEAALATIDEDLRLIVPPTTDYERLADAIRGVPRGGQSFLRDGLAEVFGQIAGDPREHVVIFWTDGEDTMSVGRPEEIEDSLSRAPNGRLILVAFPLATAGKRLRLPDSIFTDLAERSGGEVLQTGGDWLERVKGGFRRRWLVTVAPPDGARQDDTLRVDIDGRRCRARVLDLASAAGRLPGIPESTVASWRQQRDRFDVAPCAPASEDDRPWRRAPTADAALVSGCALDIVGDPGLRYSGRSWWRVEIYSPMRLASRPWVVTAGAPEDLPRSPEEALDRLAREVARYDATAGTSGPNPRIVHGHTLFTLQGPLSRAMWETRPGYRAFARRRLEAEAARGLEIVAARIRLEMPALDRGAAIRAARASVEGRRLLDAVDAPGDADLRRTIAAWLGDISARELFERWELRLAQAMVDGRSNSATAERLWRSMREQLALPEDVRTVALLVPGRDGADGPIGFWRVQLPRAYWIFARRTDDPDDYPYDHVPERPMGLLALDRALVEHPELADRGSGGAVRVRALTYEPRVKAWKEDPAHPFTRGIVRIALASEDEGDVDGVVVEGSFRAEDGAPPEIETISVQGKAVTVEASLSPP